MPSDSGPPVRRHLGEEIMRTTTLMISLMMSLMTVGANATVVEYDMHWEGAGGYTVVGMFSFDDATVGTEADDTELLSFMATAFEPDGDPLKSYDLTNQAPSFNFHFDLASQSILQSGFTTSATGFLIGNFDVNDWFFGGGTTGCAQSGNVGIVLSVQGQRKDLHPRPRHSRANYHRFTRSRPNGTRLPVA